MGFSGGHFYSHAIVAEKLYKSTTQTDIYYLKVYNPNYPNRKDYIKISQEILLDPINPSIPRVVLYFEDTSVDYDDIYGYKPNKTF